MEAAFVKHCRAPDHFRAVDANDMWSVISACPLLQSV